MKRSIRVVLKSGYSFVFQCEHMEVRTIGGEISGYSFNGAKSTYPMYIRVDDISAVIDDGETEEGE